MNAVKRFIGYIEQENGQENDSMALVVIVRELVLLLALYYIAQGILVVLWTHGMFCTVFFAAAALMAILFYRSFSHGIGTIFSVMNAAMVAVTLLGCFVLGISLGYQNVLYISLLLFLNNDHFGMRAKRIYSAVSVPVILGVAFLYRFVTGYSGDPTTMFGSFVLLSNEVLLILAIIIIGIVNSGISREAEHRLFLYNQKLLVEADTDPLTHLMNRRGIETILSGITEHYAKNGNLVCIAIGDIDFFKRVNDTYGHDAGDAVLSGIGKILSEFMKSVGTAARWGGEEFLLVFSSSNGDEAYALLEKLRTTIAETEFRYNESVIPVRMTFGLAEYDSRHDLGITLKEADDKLYMGKQNGRNQVVF